jgi:virulence-associated protein VagC
MTKYSSIVLLVISLALVGCTTTSKPTYPTQSYAPPVWLQDVLTFDGTQSGQFQRLKFLRRENKRLKPGDEVKTDAKTIVTLAFTTGKTTVILKPNTQVKILDSAIELISGQTAYPDNQGELFITTSSQGKKWPKKFRVKTKNVTITPIGTKLSIKANQQDVSITVVEGSTQLSSNTQSWQPQIVQQREKSVVRGQNVPITQPTTAAKITKLIHPITQVERVIIAKSTTPKEKTSVSQLEGTWDVTFEEHKQFGVKVFQNLHFEKDGSVVYYGYGSMGRANWKQNGNSVVFQTDKFLNLTKWKGVIKDNFLSGTVSSQSGKTYQWTAHYLGQEKPDILAFSFPCKEQGAKICLKGHFKPNLPVTLLGNKQSKTCAATTGDNFIYEEEGMLTSVKFQATKLNDVKCQNQKYFRGALVGKMPSSVQYDLIKLKKLADKSRIRQLDKIVRKSGILTWKTKRNNGEKFFTLQDSDEEDYKSISQSLPTIYNFPLQNKELLLAQYSYYLYGKEYYDGPILFLQEKKVIPVLGMCVSSLIDKTRVFRINNTYYLDSMVYVCATDNMADIILKFDSSSIVVVSVGHFAL